MKPTARALLLLFTGLALAGCAARTASLKVKAPQPPAIALADEPLSGRDYWMLRDLDDRLERARSAQGSTSGR